MHVNTFEVIKQELSVAKVPALVLLFITIAEPVSETACNIVHFTLFSRNIGMTVYIERCEKVAVPSVILYLFH